MQTTNVRLEEMLGYLREGRFVEAPHGFYAPDVVMTSPDEGVTTGSEANLEREQRFFASVQEFRTFEIGAVAASDTHGFYENVAVWLGKDGKEYRVEQLVLQKWQDGKIVYERFYHDLP
jgi:hypothetical protein